jgi:acyl-CoA synthetase (AMP-forming)/AMP-acid ligase II
MIFDNFVSVAATAPGTSGLRQGETFTSYSAVVERAQKIATGLLERGIERGTPVGLLMINGPELLTLAYAIFAAGAVVVPLNAHAPRAELAMTARKAHVRALIASLPYTEVAQALVSDLAGAAGMPLFVSGGSDDWSVVSLERHAAGRLPVIGEDDMALYMFSSGSTGIPKVVPHTHGELMVGTRANYEHRTTFEDDVQINMMPGSHAMGFLSATGQAALGASTLYWSDPQPLMLSKGRFAHAIADGGVTQVIGVPFMFDALASVKDDLDFSRLRRVTCGGVAMRKDVYDRFLARFGIRIVQAYGSTECLGIAVNDSGDPSIPWDSVGPIVSYVKAHIEPAENPFGPDYGEVVVEGGAITKGYLDAPDTNATTIRNGRFYTGDLGTIDRNGLMFIKGRTKLLIEVAGHKVDPFEIEEVLGTHPAVAEAVVVGVPDPRTGEQRLKAVIIKQAEETPDALIRYCRERLASQKVPSVVEFRDELPRSAAGKVLRGKLMESV